MSGIHEHAGARHSWRLLVALPLIATFFVVELVVALWTGSLALLSDAAHMGADVLALGAALAATTLAARFGRSGRRTFGFYRVEVFATAFIALLMVGMAGFILFEAVGRLQDPQPIQIGPMLLVGALGLLVNIVAIALLHGGAGESLSIKGAYLEVLADTLGSVGVIVAGLLLFWTGDPLWDTVIALAIAVFVAVRAGMLMREAVLILGQAAPKEAHPDRVEALMTAVDGVVEVHDLHVWTLTSGMHVATAHIVVEGRDGDAVVAEIRDSLRREVRITHPTLQVESRAAAADCEAMTW